ncbi:LamG domain-containing protein [Streptomyces sp. NPDC007346]|uniref:LamG domain-containing protein n=1 Tax=Streptomyces sp. NPDC007346 TaxID=3154682 RepID=UPI003456FF75
MLSVSPALNQQAMASSATARQLASPELRASAAAVATGERVEVVEERTERETVFANPDGATFTLEKSIIPVRVAPQGKWIEPDTTLVRHTDGSVGPKAAAVELSFSAGGDGADLVTIAEGHQPVSLGWPGVLPAPRLAGERAIYENVLPDVNLILTATVEGFRQVLEVKSPEAAANPALRSIEYRLSAENLTVQPGVGGGVDALDGNGRPVFRSPAARMWDSAGDSQAPAPAERSLYMSLPAEAGMEHPVAAGPAEEGDPLAGPGTGDQSSVMDLKLTDSAVTVEPDADLLANTDERNFPLYIDPSVELNESERTVLSSDGDVFWNFSGGTNGMSVGKCGSAVIGGVSYYCGNGYVNRMYFEFDPGKLKGKHVLDATFRVTETWSFSCAARVVDLERTNNISPSSKWPGPAKLDQMGDRSVSAGRGSNCSPAQPRAPIEFHDNPAEPDENLTPTVRSFADGKIARLTLMLMANNESDTVAWKRFDDDAVLSVEYVGKPAKPSSIGTVAGKVHDCNTAESAPAIVTDPTPDLTATAQTAAGGESGAKLRVAMDVDKKQSNGTWVNAMSEMVRPSSGYVGDNVKVTATAPTLPENALLRMRAWTRSYYGSQWLEGPSNGSTPGWCYFKIDSKAPKPPTITFNQVDPDSYTPCTANDCVPRGKPGKAGSFTLGPASGDVNTGYRYRLAGGSFDSGWSAYKSGATATINPIPPTSGTMVLYAEAKDNYGSGAANSVEFVVKEGDGPVGRWTFHEAAGAAVDSSTNDPALKDNATLAGGAVRTDQGRRGEVTIMPATSTTPAVESPDSGLRLNGTTAYTATAGPVIDTRASYTVAAWVRIDDPTRNATVVGQDGVNRSPFLLSYEHTLKKWSFREANADAPAGGTWSYKSVVSKNPAVPKVWTHLAGVFNAVDNTISFYVNGGLQGTTEFTTPWAANGPLQIGRVHWSGTYTDYFPGVIDEAAVWQEALTGVQIARENALLDPSGKASAELVAAWNPAGTQGSSLIDEVSGYGRPLTLSAGASVTDDELVLDGTTGAGTTPGPVVDDTGSFTVTTQAVVDAAKILAKPNGYRAQVLGQRTATGSSWSLWFEKTGTRQEPEFDENGDPVIDGNGNPKTTTVPVGRWHFGRLESDGNGASVQSIDEALVDTETRLTGVYNAQDKTIQLYLTSDQQTSDGIGYTAQVGVGEFAVGKGYLGAWGNFLPGRLSDIRLWAGALSDSEQVSDVVGT